MILYLQLSVNNLWSEGVCLLGYYCSLVKDHITCFFLVSGLAYSDTEDETHCEEYHLGYVIVAWSKTVSPASFWFLVWLTLRHWRWDTLWRGMSSGIYYCSLVKDHITCFFLVSGLAYSLTLKMAHIVKNIVFWDIMPCGFFKYFFAACFSC
jgi:hypothetical protein